MPSITIIGAKKKSDLWKAVEQRRQQLHPDLAKDAVITYFGQVPEYVHEPRREAQYAIIRASVEMPDEDIIRVANCFLRAIDVEVYNGQGRMAFAEKTDGSEGFFDEYCFELPKSFIILHQTGGRWTANFWPVRCTRTQDTPEEAVGEIMKQYPGSFRIGTPEMIHLNTFPAGKLLISSTYAALVAGIGTNIEIRQAWEPYAPPGASGVDERKVMLPAIRKMPLFVPQELLNAA